MLGTLLKAPEFKVGLLVIIISGIIATMSLKVSQDPSYLGSTKAAWFLMEDASGIVKNSGVSDEDAFVSQLEGMGSCQPTHFAVLCLTQPVLALSSLR